MKNPRSFLSTLIAILFLFSLPTSVSAQGKNKDITGSWEIAASSNDGDQDSVWNFARSGDKYTGEMIADGSDEKIELKNIKVDGQKIAFNLSMLAQGVNLKIEVEAEFGDKKLEGNWSANDNSGNELASGTLQGKKVTEDKTKTGLAGQWDSVAALPDGEETESTLTLSGEDGKLAGFVNGENGKTTLDKVAVKDDTLRMELVVEIEGEDRDIVIEAKHKDAHTLDGKWMLMVDGAEAASGAWSAKRKREKATSEAGGKTEVLFDGTSLDSFRGYRKEAIGAGWTISEGVLAFDGSRSGDLVTKKVYENFELSFEWKISEGGNSGVMYRVTLGDRASSKSGIEYQILDNAKHKDGKKRTTCASALYALYAPGDKTPNPVGQWNTAKIVHNGNKIEHWMNGEKVVEAEVESDDWNKRIAASKFATWEKFGKSKKGHISFQDHKNPVWYRNITIKTLD